MAVKPIPEGYHTITPYLVVEDVARLIEFLKAGLGAVTLHEPLKGPDGAIRHAEMRVGDSPLMLGGATAEYKPMPAMLYLYVEDTDALYQRAIAAGGKSIMEPTNQFYGDRNAGVLDPCGNQWWIGTHVEDVSPEEISRRMEEVAKKRGG